MSRLGTRVAAIVPIAQRRQRPSSEEAGLDSLTGLLRSAAATGTTLARLSSQESRSKARNTTAKFRVEASKFDLEAAAFRVEEEEIRVETIKERVIGKKAEKEVDRLTRLEDDGFDALMKEKSPADLDQFIKDYRFLSKSKQNEVEAYIGRQIGSDHLTQVLAEYHEWSSDPANDPKEFSLVEKLTEKLVAAGLTPGAHKAYTDYTLGQVGGIQRGIMAQQAAAESAEIRRNTQSQLIGGFGSYLMGEGDATDASFLLIDLADTAGGLAADDSKESRHNLMMRAATAAIDTHISAGTDPEIMLRRLNELQTDMPALHKGLIEAGALQLVENEIINRESRVIKGQLGEVQKRIVVAGSGRGNGPALVALRNELAAIDTSDMSSEASQGVNGRIGTMIFDADTRIRTIELERGEYNRIMRNLGSGDRLGPGESANPKPMNQVAQDIMAQKGATLPIVAATFVDDGYGMPPYLMDLLKKDLDVTMGAGNLARAYRTWEAVTAADEDFGFRLINAQKVEGMQFLRRIVNWTGQADSDTDKVNEILAIVESGSFQRIQTTPPPQSTPADTLVRSAHNVYSAEHRHKSAQNVRDALDLNFEPPPHVINYFMDSFSYKNTMIQLNDLNDNASVAAMEAQTVTQATSALQKEFHVLEPDGGEVMIVEERFFPGIAGSQVIEEAVNDGVRDIQKTLDATVNFGVPVKVAGGRRWWPVVSDDPGHDPSRAGIKAFIEWDATSNAFQTIEREGNEDVFDTAASRVLRGHTNREMNPIQRLQRRGGEPNTIGQLDFHTTGSRGYQVMAVIERAWDRQSNEPFNIEVSQHARFATDFAKTQLKFDGGFGTIMVNRNDPLISGGSVR